MDLFLDQAKNEIKIKLDQGYIVRLWGKKTILQLISFIEVFPTVHCGTKTQRGF